MIFGTCAMMAGQFTLVLRFLFVEHHPLLNPGATSTTVFALLVVFIVMLLFGLTAPALPRLFPGLTGTSTPPPSTTRVYSWLSWLMAALSVLMAGSVIPYFPPLWPLSLLGVAALVFAILCTRSHLRERARLLAETAEGEGRC